MLKIRIAAFLVAAGCLAAAWETAHLDGGPLRTPLTLVAFVWLLLFATALVAVSCLPRRRLSNLAERGARLHDALAKISLPDERWAGNVLIGIGLVTYVALVIIYIPRQIPPENNDQGMYLALADEINEAGGILGCLRDLFTGRFAEANRHPLYPMLLSFTPTYEGGKRLSAVLGGITLAMLTLLIARRFHRLIAGIFCVLLATNAAYLFVSTLIACEVLVVLTAGLVWYLCLPGQSQSVAAPQPHPDDGIVQHAAVFGAVFGSMYLIKAHAVLLMGGLGLWIAARFSSLVARPKYWLAAAVPFVLGFAIVASPLLVRNVVRYGNPLFNVNGHLLFEDKFVDPVALAESKTTRQALADYWRSHTVRQMIAREVKGLAWESFIIVRTFGPSPWDDGRVLFGALIAVACCVGLMTEPGGKTDLLWVWGIVLWLFFAWYVPIAAGERFILPILVPVLAYASIGGLRLVRLVFPDATMHNIGVGFVVVAMMGCVATIILTQAYLEFLPPG